MKPVLFLLCSAVFAAQGAVPEIADDGLRQAYERAIYSLHASGDATWRGENRAQRLSLEFDSGGARLSQAQGAVEFGLTGFGYGDRLATPARVRPVAVANRVEYRRGDVTEWYVNGAEGLEQGFTFARPPDAGRRKGPLTIVFGVSGAFMPALAEGSVLLGGAFRYSGLTARDSRGQTMPSRLEVRGREIRILVDDAMAEYPLIVDPTWSQQQEVLATTQGSNYNFGYAVSISGDTALIGARQEMVGSNQAQGSAYVFVRSGTTWSLQQELTSSDGASQDQFGRSVSVSGDTAAIGAPNHTASSHNRQGAVYVFVRSGTTWSLQQEITSSDGLASDGFGYSVGLIAGTVVAGANKHKVSTHTSQGAAYVFVQSGSTWSQQAELISSDGAANDQFGDAVALSGGTALIGALGHKVGSNSAQGSAYVFVQSGSTWSQQQELTSSDGAASDVFGYSVALDGGTAAIGATQHEVGSNLYAGAAYIFVQNGTTWTQQGELTASDGAYQDELGGSVAVSGGTAVAGASNHAVSGHAQQGAAYVFVQSGTSWSQQQELTSSDGAASDLYGFSVALDQGTVVVGAGLGDGSYGSAYMYVLPAYLSVTAAHSSPIFQSGPGAITLTVANEGQATAAAATVSDTIDSAFTINSASSGCSVSGQTVTCTLSPGSSASSTAFSVYVTAAPGASASILNAATLSDATDSIASASSSDTIAVTSQAAQVDSSLNQLALSGSTDNGSCASGNMTLTATDQLQNTSGSTLTNPYAVISSLTQGNTLISQSASAASVAAGANVTFTFHIQLASCNTFQLLFDVRSN